MKYKTAFSAILLCIAMSLSAEDGIVKIGDRIYGESDIVSVMKENLHLEPFTALQKIKRLAMAEQLAKKRKLDMSDPEKSLYLAVTGADLENDRSLANAPDIPLHVKKPASLREGMFEQWLTELAENTIPVYVLDHDKLWEIFKQTDSYKVRAEHGHVIKPEDATYTWADLSVESSDIVATKKGKEFIKGDEFNAYLKRNTSALTLLGKRRKSPTQARMDITRLIIAGNLLLEECKKNKEKFTDIEIERAVSKCARENRINEDFDIKGLEAQTLSNYMDVLNSRSIEKNKAKINTLRAVLKDSAQCAENDFQTITLLIHAAYSHSEAQIKKSIKDDEIYEWMKAKSFKGSIDDARLTMTRERQEKHIDELIAAEEVVVSVK
jgi:hypothetical protein